MQQQRREISEMSSENVTKKEKKKEKENRKTRRKEMAKLWRVKEDNLSDIE